MELAPARCIALLCVTLSATMNWDLGKGKGYYSGAQSGYGYGQGQGQGKGYGYKGGKMHATIPIHM
eukprot:10077553-Karenia_brevis.AAC.1